VILVFVVLKLWLDATTADAIRRMIL